MPGLLAVVPRLSAPLLRSSVDMLGSFAIMPKLSPAVPGLSVLMSAFIFVLRSSDLVSPSASAPVLLGLSPLLFPALSLPKTTMPD